MKGQKQKNKVQQIAQNHPTIFSISIFESAQEFVAVYLALESQNEQQRMSAGRYLQSLLHRTKSAPIALTYTKEFTLLKSQSQIQLTIIRFISQLSDLSAGKSMQSSLSYIIDNSSFLTELRHNLTHRVMVKGLVIERGKQMILRQLKEKYWKVMFQKVWKTYFIDGEKVNNIFANIINQNIAEQNNELKISQWISKSNLYRQYKGELVSQESNKMSFDYLFKHCQSNYEFKSLMKGYIVKKMLPELRKRLFDDNETEQKEGFQTKEINREIVSEYLSLQSLSQSTHFNLRATIIFSTLLDLLLSLCKYDQLSNQSQTRLLLSQTIMILISQLQSINKNRSKQPNNRSVNPLQIICSPVVIKKFRQAYLLKYIDQYNNLINSLPQEIIGEIKRYWQQKQIKMGKQLIVEY